MKQTLGIYIRERRQDLGLTQEGLAERVGGNIRQAEISQLEHNRITLPRRARLEQLAAALEVSLGELLMRSGWMDGHQRVDISPNGQQDIPDDRSLIDAGTVDLIQDALGQVAALRAFIEDMDVVLETAEGALTLVLDATRGTAIKPPIGVIDQWETDEVFIA